MWGTGQKERQQEADTAVEEKEETGQVRSRLPEVVTPVLQHLKGSVLFKASWHNFSSSSCRTDSFSAQQRKESMLRNGCSFREDWDSGK